MRLNGCYMHTVENAVTHIFLQNPKLMSEAFSQLTTKAYIESLTHTLIDDVT